MDRRRHTDYHLAFDSDGEVVTWVTEELLHQARINFVVEDPWSHVRELGIISSAQYPDFYARLHLMFLIGLIPIIFGLRA
jgi:hypothetical protein